MDSSLALSMKEQVLTMMTSASSAEGVTTRPSAPAAPRIISESTVFFGQPRLIMFTRISVASGAGPGFRAFTLRPSLRIRLFPLLESVVDLAGLAALEGSDEAVLVHDFHQAGGTRVADLELSLEQGHRPALRSEDDAHGLLVELVLLVAVAGALGAEDGELRAELWLRLLDCGSYHVANFLVRDKCALHALQRRRAGRQVEHVALAEQL